MFHRTLTGLLAGLLVLLVAFAVLMGGYGLAQAAQDATAAAVFWWVAMGCLALTLLDLVLLVATLTIAWLLQPPPDA